MDWLLIIATASALGVVDNIQVHPMREAQCRASLVAMAPLQNNNLRAVCIGPHGEIAKMDPVK